MNLNGYLVLATSSENISTTSSELIFSIIAILISVVSLFYSNRHNKINLESKYADDIFKEYILKKIPETRNKITHNGEKLNGTDDLIEVLNSLRKDSLYYSFHNKKFYEQLKKETQELEDILVESGNKLYSNDDFRSFLDSIEKHMTNIYKLIHDNYLGKKFVFSSFKSDIKKYWYYVIILFLIIIILYMYIK